MRNIILFMLLCLGSVCLPAQSILDERVEAMAGKLANQLNLRKVKRVGVADFTYGGQKNTRIGKYVADRLSGKMLEAGAIFNITDRETVRQALSAPASASAASLPINDRTELNVNTYLGENATPEQKQEAAISEAVNLIQWLATKPSNPLKSIDVLIYGDIEEMGDNLVITARASKTGKKADQVGFAEAIFVIRPDVRRLLNDGREVAPPPVQDTPIQPDRPITDRPPPPPSGVTPFKHQHFTFEMLGCSQTGRNVECKLSVLSSGQNDDLWIYLNGTRILDANGGHEFGLAEVKLADVSSTSYRAGKTLVADHPIEVVLRFQEVNRQVTSISMLQINANSFHPVMKNIPVR